MLSKYQEVMEHVKVDDEMRKRILQNVGKELEKDTKHVEKKAKIIPFQRYAAVAATFAILLVGSYAVIQTTGDIKNTADTASVYETAKEEAASMAEAPAMEEAATEAPAMEAAEAEPAAPIMEAAAPKSEEEFAAPGIGIAGSTAQKNDEETYAHIAVTESASSSHASMVAPIVAGVAIVAVIAGLIAGIITLVRKKKK